MYVTISKNLPNKKLLKDFVKWAAIKLLGSRIADNLEIDIDLVPDENTTQYASCDTIDTERYPRSFSIEIYKKMRTFDNLLFLAHEMVHVKQLARRELLVKSYKKGPTRYFWFKELQEDINYWDLPWEIEAHGREYGLLFQYVEEKFTETPVWWPNNDLDRLYINDYISNVRMLPN